MGERRQKDTTRSSEPKPECETFCRTMTRFLQQMEVWRYHYRLKEFKGHYHTQYRLLP